MNTAGLVSGALNIESVTGEEQVTIATKGTREAQAAARQLAASALKIEEVAATDYDLVLADAAGKLKKFTSGDPVTVTVTDDDTGGWPEGACQVLLYQDGVGAVTVQGDAGVTVNNAGALAAQFSMAMVMRVGPNEWTLTGALA